MINIIGFILILLTFVILIFLIVYNVKFETKETLFAKYYILKYWSVCDYYAKEIILWKRKKP